MTTEKMPDEMYITFTLPGAVYRYTRAEPVEELLKQACAALFVASVAMNRAGFMGYPEQCDESITAINKFLGGGEKE